MRMYKDGKYVIDFKYNLRLYAQLIRPYTWLIVALLALVLIIEASLTVEKYLFKVIIDGAEEYGASLLTQNEFVNLALIVAGAFLVTIVLTAIAQWLKIHALNKLDSRIMTDLKQKLFDHIITLSYNFHTTHKTGSLISRLIRGGGAMEAVTDVFIFNVTPLIIQLVIVTAALFTINTASAITVLATVALYLAFSLTLQHAQRRANVELNELEDLEKANVSDAFTNVDSVKYFGKEEFVKKKFHGYINRTRQGLLDYWNYFRWADSVQRIILGAGAVLLLYFPFKGFLDGNMSVGDLVFTYTVYTNLFTPLFGFVQGSRTFYRAMADFESLFQYHRIENEIKDKKNAPKMHIKDGTVEFRDISFNYGRRKLFEKFNLYVNEGEKIALVGHSGSGKSTLVKLLYRFYDTQQGEVLIDGKNVADFKQESLRSEIAIVPQECVLFDDTLYNNIAFSNPKATRQQVLEAMKFAQLDEVVKEFPKGVNTIVGERGVRLSGGEKQRVSIARALLADKKILVLDEATSSLDSKTEHEIQKDLQELMKGRTSIIIAHRLSTIMTADTIVVMEKGKIVQMGVHDDLIEQPGPYADLWNLQKGGYIDQ